ncbi:MAG: RidA family protein [Phycisphaerales bacterium JB037]
MDQPHSPEEALRRLGHELPEAPKPVAAYVPAVRSGSLLFVAGQIPMSGGRLMMTGSVPGAVSLEDAQRCARQCALNGLAVAKAALGSLDAIARVVRLGCFVASEASFTDQPKVANAASELMLEVFGESGRHARAAVGSISLPLGAPVEIEFIFEVRD